ncbi:MAG: helix-turn-helix transcriptional regulator [Candidatus Paceibacterota bacterium]
MSKLVYSKDYKAIIECLKTACIEADLSQQVRVADKFGKPQFYISKIEFGERRLDVAEMKKFPAIYKKPVDFFLK